MSSAKMDLCHVCGSGDLQRMPRYSELHRVTSDCKPWPRGGELAVCRACGCAQAPASRQWQEESARIYEAYTIYHQGQGIEQSVFDEAGQPSTRSARLLQRLRSEIPLPASGHLLDVGCGNGGLLRAFNQLWPEWKLSGIEVNETNRAVVEKIPGVEKFYTGDVAALPKRFDMITLIHVLEHIGAPRDFLTQVREKLAPGGLHLIEVPNCEQNPFMFLVADHATHFFPRHLEILVKAAGFQVERAATDWVPKEISVAARPGTPAQKPKQEEGEAVARVQSSLDWLLGIIASAQKIRAAGAFGIFGTSIAATWLFAELDGQVDFFVDEDPSRIGQQHFGRPIYRPSDAPERSQIFVALPPALARGVVARQDASRANWHVPSEIGSVSPLP